jgi:hypothetical protein
LDRHLATRPGLPAKPTASVKPRTDGSGAGIDDFGPFLLRGIKAHV